MSSRRTATAAIALLLLSLVACGGSDKSAKPAATTPSPSTSSATTSTPTTSVRTAAYSTRFFAPPIDVVLPSYVKRMPTQENANFVTWVAPDDSLAVRFLRPDNLYRPGSATSGPVPADYVPYLLSQSDHGAHFADRKDTKVDGHRAVLFTVTTSQPIDGSLGCPGTGIAAEDCYGIQPEFSVPLAVVDTEQGALLIWLRIPVDAKADVAAGRQRLDQLLSDVRFADRPVEPA